jgi:hypothetical protein
VTTPAKGRYLRVKNYELYQSFRRPNPEWVRLHLAIWNDFEFIKLTDPAKLLLVAIFSVISRQKKFLIQDDPAFIATLCHLSAVTSSRKNLDSLIERGFLIVIENAAEYVPVMTDPKPRAAGSNISQVSLGLFGIQDALLDSFDQFWRVYPRREAKRDGLKAWRQLNPDPALAAKIILAVAARVSGDWSDREQKHLPLPATYIRGRRWEDEVPVGTGVTGNKKGAVASNLHDLKTEARARDQRTGDRDTGKGQGRVVSTAGRPPDGT